MYHSYGLPALFNPSDSLTAYGDNPWLGGAVDRIAQTLARTNFSLQQVNTNGEIEIVQKHEALSTLRKPQPTVGGKSLITNMDLKLVTGYHLCLNGEAFWLLDKRRTINGAPTYIDLLIPEFVFQRIVDGELVEYIYRLPNAEFSFRPQDVVHFKLPDPQKWQRGHSPIQSIRYALETYKEADKHNLRKIQNGAVPGGTLETDQPVAEPERKKILQQWMQRFGGSDNAGKVAMLPMGLKFNKTQESNADMQYVEGKSTNRTEILARYGVGPEILGLTESQTRANAEAAIFVFMKFGASFFIEKFADTLNNDYLPAFPGTDGLEFSFPDPVPENMEEKRANGTALFQSGSLTPDEFRKMFGMEPLGIQGVTDVPYLDMGKVPIGESPPLAA